MKNEIEGIRKDILNYFDINGRTDDKEEYELSEGGLYYFTAEKYKQNDPNRNWIICKIEVWDIEKNNMIFEYLTNAEDSVYCAKWINKQGKDYLFLPEAFQGQSVLDIATLHLYSFFSKEDPFIWRAIYPSPDMNKIAVDGCYWGCPNELRVYDTREITQLPYKIIYQDSNFSNQNGCVIEHWKNSNTLVVC